MFCKCRSYVGQPTAHSAAGSRIRSNNNSVLLGYLQLSGNNTDQKPRCPSLRCLLQFCWIQSSRQFVPEVLWNRSWNATRLKTNLPHFLTRARCDLENFFGRMDNLYTRKEMKQMNGFTRSFRFPLDASLF